MTEMIERVAKAIHAARQQRGFSGEALWEYEPANIQELFRHTARAAIEVMQDPPDMGDWPRYNSGEYSRRNIEAFIDDALGPR